MDLGMLIAFAVMPKQAPVPTLWLLPSGKVEVEGRTFNPRFAPGTRVIKTGLGATYDFHGPKSGLHFGDLKPLRLTDSMTISLWINPRSYVNDGPGAQILFRGDDRNGVDPYRLVIHSDGTINFGIQTDRDENAHVTADLPLHRWSQVVANWNADSGFMKIWMNGELVGTRKMSIRPFAELDRQHAPGVSVGNVQNDQGPHNQPFNGMLADLRLYRGAWTPDELGLENQRHEPAARKVVSVD